VSTAKLTSPRTVLLRLAGEIDLASGGEAREQVHRAVADGGPDIVLVLDLSAVSFIDSGGVGVLIAARRLLRSGAGELRLVLPDARDGGCVEVHRVFNALGVRRLFDIHPDLASATAPVTAPVAAPVAASRALSAAQ
jgi:anti-anti-sigma factor